MAARRTSYSTGPAPAPRYYGYAVNDKRAGVPDTGTASPTTTPAATPSYWSPAYLSTSAGTSGGGEHLNATERLRLRRGGGGYGGGGYSGMAQNFESTASLGPGSYWPGHGADFQRDSQMAAIMPQNYQGYIGGQAQPGAMAAWLQFQNAGGGVAAARRAHGAQYGTFGMGGGGGGGGSSFSDAYAEANAANEARYRDVLGGYQNRYERNMEDLRGSGAQERNDINEAYKDQWAARQQSMIGRGLGNSSILDTMQAGNERERINDQGRLEERLRQQRIGLDTSLSGDTLGFMERRVDQQPDPMLAAQLAQGLGQAGYGAGGVGGGGQQYMTTYAPAGGGDAGGYMLPVGYMGGGGGGASNARYLANRDYWRRYNNSVIGGRRGGIPGRLLPAAMPLPMGDDVAIV